METLWLITNRQSGSATPAKCAAIEALFSERGVKLAGRTHFPEDALPSPADLDNAGVDTLMLFAGDGTINAVLGALEAWKGAFLLLPGGTMNMLVKQLHASLDPAEIIRAAHGNAQCVPVPYIKGGMHRAYVGLILGPAGSWARAREAIREKKASRLIRAVRLAWRRTFRDHVRIVGAPGLKRGYQAVFVTPHSDGVEAAAIEAQDWTSILELGWGWVSGDWLKAQAVTRSAAHELIIAGSKPVLALFDGEPQTLAPGTKIIGARSAACFLSTGKEPS